MDEPETTHFLMKMEIEDEVVQDELDNGSAAAAAVIMVLGAAGFVLNAESQATSTFVDHIYFPTLG